MPTFHTLPLVPDAAFTPGIKSFWLPAQAFVEVDSSLPVVLLSGPSSAQNVSASDSSWRGLFYAKGVVGQVRRRAFPSFASVRLMSNACFLLPLADMKVPNVKANSSGVPQAGSDRPLGSMVALSPGDGNTVFPAERRCVVFRSVF